MNNVEVFDDFKKIFKEIHGREFSQQEEMLIRMAGEKVMYFKPLYASNLETCVCLSAKQLDSLEEFEKTVNAM